MEHQAGGNQRREREADGHPSHAGQLSLVQGIYYAITGIWPILHIRSFEAITGPKKERWLVKTVGALVGILGGVLIKAGIRDRPSDDLALTAAASAAALAAVDVVYTARNRISPVYLLDAAAELVLVAGWILVYKGTSRRRKLFE